MSDKADSMPHVLDPETIEWELRQPYPAPYDQAQLLLSSGDQLFLYTDGLTDAPGAAGRRFGEERLRAVLNGLPPMDVSAIKRGVLNALQQHTGGALDHDDVTLIVAEVRSAVRTPAAPTRNPGARGGRQSGHRCCRA